MSFFCLYVLGLDLSVEKEEKNGEGELVAQEFVFDGTGRNGEGTGSRGEAGRVSGVVADSFVWGCFLVVVASDGAELGGVVDSDQVLGSREWI